MRFDASGITQGLDALQSKSEQQLWMFCDTGAKKMEGYAKSNAKWSDRSGRARQGLNGTAERAYPGFRIKISHGVDYGIYLEMANEKRYAILPDTLRYGEESILPAFANLIERL